MVNSNGKDKDKPADDVIVRATPPPWIFVPNDKLENPEDKETCAVATEDGKVIGLFGCAGDALRAVSVVNAANGINNLFLDGGILTTLTELLASYVAKDKCSCPKPPVPVGKTGETKKCMRCLADETLTNMGGDSLAAAPPPSQGGGAKS